MGDDREATVRIMISYRRDDSAGHAGRLFDALSGRFGRDNVFMDIDTIEPGVDFTEVIAGALESCDVFLEVIGRQWLTATDRAGRRRLDDPGDHLRLEVETAIRSDARVVPLLVQGAEMPSPEDLPESMRRLALRNALELSDSRWRYDVERLFHAIERAARTAPTDDVAVVAAAPAAAVREPVPPPPPGVLTEAGAAPAGGTPGGGRSRKRWVVGTIVAAVIAVGVALPLLLTGGGDRPAGSGTNPTSSAGAGTDEPALRSLFADQAGWYTGGHGEELYATVTPHVASGCSRETFLSGITDEAGLYANATFEATAARVDGVDGEVDYVLRDPGRDDHQGTMDYQVVDGSWRLESGYFIPGTCS